MSIVQQPMEGQSRADHRRDPAKAPTVSDHRLAADELAILLAARPAMLAKLLDEHQTDSRGHCRVCTLGGQQGHQSWPCNIAAAALRAAQIRDAEASR